jgi:hypothetical protein
MSWQPSSLVKSFHNANRFGHSNQLQSYNEPWSAWQSYVLGVASNGVAIATIGFLLFLGVMCAMFAVCCCARRACNYKRIKADGAVLVPAALPLLLPRCAALGCTATISHALFVYTARVRSCRRPCIVSKTFVLGTASVACRHGLLVRAGCYLRVQLCEVGASPVAFVVARHLWRGRFRHAQNVIVFNVLCFVCLTFQL